jgi:carboxyl-terminal processing protease
MTDPHGAPPTAPWQPLRPSGAQPEQPRGGSSLPWLMALALAAVVGSLLFLGGYLAAGRGTGSGCAAPSDEFEALCDAYAELKRQYVDELDDAKLTEGAIRGMFQYGVQDPYSGYMPPQEYEQALGDLSGRFSGIGAEMAMKNLVDPGNLEECTEFSEDHCVFVVVAPLADSPAEEAGIEAGDIVLAVDGETVNGKTMSDMIAKVRGEAGTDVTLSLQRGERAFELTITRAEITIREVVTRVLEGGIGYIKLNSFSGTSVDQFREGVRSLLSDGARRIVLDLRDNPGGYIDAAQHVSSEFIESGLIFSQESAGDEMQEWTASGDGAATSPSIPMAVLVNGGTASASEIVAAALKEHGRATVIGQPTFGKNTVQIWTELENRGGVRITISRWFTPDHNSVAPAGLRPDIVVDIPPETPPETDLILERAVAFLQGREVGERSSPAPLPSGSPSAAAPGLLVGVEPLALRRAAS